MKTLLVFVPSRFDSEEPGRMFGKIVNDKENSVSKFYIIGIQDFPLKINNDILGYFSGTDKDNWQLSKSHSNWINLYLNPLERDTKISYDYCLENIFIDNQKVSLETCHAMVIIYDQLSLLKSEIFVNLTSKDHFSELKEILGKKAIQDEIQKKTWFNIVNEGFLINIALLFLYPIVFLCSVTNMLLPILKYSTLGLHVNGWLENLRWMLNSIIERRRITIKTGNHILATIVDVLLGILMLRLLSANIGNVVPSSILLDNADKVVKSLKGLVNWLMGSPAGLKLNHSFNAVLGKFFLYHIHLWWTFLVVLKPLLDFAFKVLLLFGGLGITFQISIAADLLALVSFHSYCIYVYAARLFNIQVRGLTALFRLFLGKKKNPLRERVDSCEYQPDQLFVGTLIFTILLFLMPTTWVYYSVFTTLRLIMIGLGGTLTRLRFHVQVIPIYTFFNWIFKTKSASSSMNVRLYSRAEGPITLISKTVVSPWSKTWKQCVPDTIKFYPPIEWNAIVKNIIWGQLLYPL
ncbi:phosphatidylinositol N-acetylglucosaminyltransferase subunit Q isoform X1 [Belonocnema kinseyi]|uniref:phosphatidylinositol N-acetylglucosaminyltransferase subunit Q isoform X1 n=1 Tax=Belonocnema kinseyi TaxID=2817044 RepID=UPI00143D146A|nr:phosphatidylinositol N-acetylglucosaminyltransferase subunit Q isoform X1 [Belonocnema kinseyi]